MKRAAIILMLAAAVTGCATKQWTKDGATAADTQKAKLECEFEAAKHDVDVMNTTWQSELKQAHLISLCMRSKGYSS